MLVSSNDILRSTLTLPTLPDTPSHSYNFNRLFPYQKRAETSLNTNDMLLHYLPPMGLRLSQALGDNFIVRGNTQTWRSLPRAAG